MIKKLILTETKPSNLRKRLSTLIYQLKALAWMILMDISLQYPLNKVAKLKIALLLGIFVKLETLLM